MTEVHAPKPSPVLPFGDHSRRRRLVKVVLWLCGLALGLAILEFLGVDIRDWIDELWDSLTSIPAEYLAAGFGLQTVQTTLTALGWYFILRAAFPQGQVSYVQVLAAYAAGVALNGFLPANIGTVVMLFMFVAMIPSANLPGVLGGMVVQKIFFTVAGTFVYLYLFLSVPGSFDLQLGGAHDHPVFTAIILVGGAFLVFLLGRLFWRKLRGLWEKAKAGGAILARPGEYAIKVVLPSFGAWLAKLGVTGIFLAAYGIPVTFHTIMSVVGGNSLANTVSATPGGVGVNQAVNVAALSGEVDSATATAYSLGQQLAVTAWNVVFGLALVVWGFGWTGGKALVEESYADAKVRIAEQKAQREAKKKENEKEGRGLLSRVRHPRADVSAAEPVGGEQAGEQ
jgi:uncharacterized membrane protein YbhN (UPF0104 family)